MSEAYQAHPLTSQTADMTYPLVQMMQVDMSFDRWRAFVGRYCLPVGDSQAEKRAGRNVDADQILWQRQRGIIVFSNERGYIHGLFSYYVRDDMADGLVLHVDNVMAVEIVAGAYVYDAMRDAMSRLARDHKCANVYVSLGECDDRLRDYFSKAGYVPSKVRYCAPATPRLSA
ncbi:MULTISPECIES: hypothetical protein [Thalassospira]|uniref:N-acetyltransferase domain-containing protein n=2 Tax=Thalassospira TaxID=168934 RepID=A0A367W7Q5_9PROT|nr:MULTISPECIES: hypothetical protein [Thalassospira]MDG4720544.1 hypothetical protein [Thalassospira sp. FZY0004]RCK37478.1 hypothetical protein TH19_09440 [Thalassospira profundimaris]